jgi:hypothetical protein
VLLVMGFVRSLADELAGQRRCAHGRNTVKPSSCSHGNTIAP